jgi:spore coat protein U-like protein
VYTDTVAVELSVLSHAGAWRLPAVGLGMLLAQGALAATGSTFTVSAQIVAGCLVVAGVTTYGTLDFGSSRRCPRPPQHVAGWHHGDLPVHAGRGHEHEPGRRAEQRQRHRNLKRSGGTQVLAYQLYRDAAYSQSLGIGQSVAVSYSDPTAIKLPVYGRSADRHAAGRDLHRCGASDGDLVKPAP